MISEALYCRKQEVCAAPRPEHVLRQQCWLVSPGSQGWPTVPVAFWAVMLFPLVSFCVQSTPKRVTVAEVTYHPFASSCVWYC